MRRRLFTLTGAVSLLIVVAFVVPLAGLVRQLSHDRAITTAENVAQFTALSLTATADDGRSAAERAVTSNRGILLSVILPDGTVVGRPLDPGEDISRPLQGTAGRAAVEGGEAVYAPAFTPDGITIVRVLVEEEQLRAGVGGAWLGLGILGLVLVVLAVWLGDLLGRSLRRPVDELAVAARTLAGGNLETRVEPSGPAEVQSVAHQFNRMAEQVSELLRHERETAADLSHRLRTPMAALRLEIESVPETEIRERLLDDLSELERVVDFVIAETRRPDRQRRSNACRVIDVVTERATYWEALAEEQERATTTAVNADGELLVELSREDLAAALDAVIGNVFSHTDEGVPYRITCTVRGALGTVIVDDAGPGIPPRALDRGVSLGGGTGLGLDIARGTADATAGSLSVEASPMGGARVVLSLTGTPIPRPGRITPPVPVDRPNPVIASDVKLP